MNIILSIHPKWAEKIYKGEKTVEWRKGSPKRINPSKVFIYETAPVCKVTGYIVLEGFAGLNIKHASEFTYSEEAIKRGCVSYEDLVKYQGNSGYITAWFIKEKVKFETPRTLADFGFKRPPQSWQYTEVEV